MPLISVILPFYNPDINTFNLAIESIVQQAYTNWELILINNNSSDKSANMARSWAEKNPKICLAEELNQGIAHALNKGLQLSNGELIARMDADDISLSDRLQKQVEVLNNKPDLGVVSCQTTFQSKLSKAEGYSIFVDWQNTIISEEEHHKNRFVESPVSHPTVLFRKELINRFGNYTAENIPEDYELWLRWMNKGVTFYKIPDALYVWNDHPSRLSRNSKQYSQEAFLEVKCIYIAKWLDQNLDSDRKIIICGTGKKSLLAAKDLESKGVKIFGFTDVVEKKVSGYSFVIAKNISSNDNNFYINFIGKRGVGNHIRSFFLSKGLLEERDFILAG